MLAAIKEVKESSLNVEIKVYLTSSFHSKMLCSLGLVWALYAIEAEENIN